MLAAYGEAAEVFRAGQADLARVKDVPPALAEKIAQTNPAQVAEKELGYCEKLGAAVALLGEEGYPAPLANTHAPPPVLYISGQWRKEDELSIAVVGTRGATGYGRAMAGKFGGALAEAGITVVSGLARGIDTIAHRAALANGGRTVAVIGCGLNIYYPPENRDLQKKIPDNGAVISQFAITTSPGKTNFPIRNRVISGLTLGSLIIEAPERSGALSTAAAALEANREVFALPGPVNSKKSEGANRLIKRGHAKLAQTVDDILDELPVEARRTAATRQASLDLKEQPDLTAEEEAVMKNLDGAEKHIDQLASQSGLPSHRVSAILLSLEIKGLVKQAAGKMFIRI